MDAFEQKRGDDAEGRQHRDQRGADQERDKEPFKDIAGAKFRADPAVGQKEPRQRRGNHRDRHCQTRGLLHGAVGLRGLEDIRLHLGPKGDPDFRQTRAHIGKIRAHPLKIVFGQAIRRGDRIEPVRHPAHVAHHKAERAAFRNVFGGQIGGYPALDHDRLHEEPCAKQDKRGDRGKEKDGLTVIADQRMQLAPVAAGQRHRPAACQNIPRGRDGQDDQDKDGDAHVSLPDRKTGGAEAPPA